MPRTPNMRPGDDIVVRVREITEAQKAHIDDIVGGDWQHGEILKDGASFIEATVATLDALIEDLEFKLGDDHHMFVAGGSHKDLTDHQINMVVSNIEKCLKGAISKIQKAIIKEAKERARIEDVTSKPEPLPELDTYFKPERLPAQPTPAKHRERMVRYDILKTFDLAFFATEDHAREFADFVAQQGDTYRLKGLEHMPCGREKHLDIPKQNLFAVSCKGR